MMLYSLIELKEVNNKLIILFNIELYMRKTKTFLLNKKESRSNTSEKINITIKVLYDIVDLKIESKDELKYLIISTAQKTLGQLKSSMLNFSIDKTSDNTYNIQIDNISINLLRTVFLLIGNGIKVLII